MRKVLTHTRLDPKLSNQLPHVAEFHLRAEIPAAAAVPAERETRVHLIAPDDRPVVIAALVAPGPRRAAVEHRPDRHELGDAHSGRFREGRRQTRDVVIRLELRELLFDHIHRGRDGTLHRKRFQALLR